MNYSNSELLFPYIQRNLLTRYESFILQSTTYFSNRILWIFQSRIKFLHVKYITIRYLHRLILRTIKIKFLVAFKSCLLASFRKFRVKFITMLNFHKNNFASVYSK